MPFDPLVANPGRLRILTALASHGSQPFVRLRQSTDLTDGNLSTHARRLQSAGLVRIDKSFEGGKPLTRLDLTPLGRQALQAHADELLSAMDASRPPVAPAADSDEWVD
jgi:DNA-binding MarR family transcriptional regulator